VTRQNFLITFLLLSVVLAQAEPIPYVPYRIETEEVDEYVRRVQRFPLYVVQQTPVPRSVVKGEPLELTVTFNQAVEPESLPPHSTEWELSTPHGVINAQNLEQFGEAAYTTLPVGTTPPNTLVLTLPGLTLEPDTLHELSLRLSPRKVDRLPAQPESQVDLKPFQFRLEELRLPELEGRAALLFEVEEEEPPTPIFKPALLRGVWQKRKLRLQVVDSPLPTTLPYLKRTLLIEAPLEEGATAGQSVKLAEGDSVLYTEEFFESGEPSQAVQRAAEVSRWSCVGGELTVLERAPESVTLQLDMELAGEQVKPRRLSGQVQFKVRPRRRP